jgi:hypothetical protein
VELREAGRRLPLQPRVPGRLLPHHVGELAGQESASRGILRGEATRAEDHLVTDCVG